MLLGFRNPVGLSVLISAIALSGTVLTTICTYLVPFLPVLNGTFALSREAALPASLSSDRRTPDRRARTDSFSDRPPQTEFFSDRRSQTDSFSDRRERRPQNDSFSESAASESEGRHTTQAITWRCSFLAVHLLQDSYSENHQICCHHHEICCHLSALSDQSFLHTTQAVTWRCSFFAVHLLRSAS